MKSKNGMYVRKLWETAKIDICMIQNCDKFSGFYECTFDMYMKIFDLKTKKKKRLAFEEKNNIKHENDFEQLMKKQIGTSSTKCQRQQQYSAFVVVVVVVVVIVTIFSKSFDFRFGERMWIFAVLLYFRNFDEPCGCPYSQPFFFFWKKNTIM